MITAKQRKEALELLSVASDLSTEYKIEILDIAHETRIEREKLFDNSNDYRIVIFTA